MRTDYEIRKDISDEYKKRKTIIDEIEGILFRDGRINEEANPEIIIKALKKETVIQGNMLNLLKELDSVVNRF